MRRELSGLLLASMLYAGSSDSRAASSAETHHDSFKAIGEASELVGRDPAAALEKLKSVKPVIGKGSPFRKPFLFYRAKALIGLGKSEAAESDLFELQSLNPGKGWNRAALGELVRVYALAGEWDKARRTTREIGKRFGSSRGDELFRGAAFEVSLDKEAEIPRQVLETVASFYPLTASSRPAFRAIFDGACEGGNDQRASREMLQKMVRHADVDQGLKALILWGLEETSNPAADVRVADVTEKYELLKRAKLLPEATDYVRLVLAQNGGSSPEVESGARYLLGKLLSDQGLFAASVDAFVRFVADFPDHRLAEQARSDLYLGLARLGQWDAAARGFAELAMRDGSESNRWNHFWATYRASQFEAALALLDRKNYVPERPERGFAGLLYWRGRILERMQKTVEADAAYREVLSRAGDSFYALMLSVRRPDLVGKGEQVTQLAEGPGTFSVAGEGDSEDGPDVVKAGPSPLSDKDLASKDVIKIARQFLAAGLVDAARFEVAGVKWGQIPDEQTFLEAEKIAAQVRQYQVARRFSWSRHSPLRVLPTSWRDLADHQHRRKELWKTFYPLAYWDRVAGESKRYGMDPLMLLSFMRTESFYDRDALSGAGARGLMQLMPATAARIARETEETPFDIGALFAPRYNIRLGAAYLSKLMMYYQGNVFMAAAAYNGGPFNVTKWLAGCGDCQIDEFVENITFRETRRYVKEVARSWGNYTRIYEKQPPFLQIPKIALVEPQGQDPY